MKNEKGFTFIEIIAVMVILSILAAVAVQKYLNIANVARTRAAQGAIAEIKGRLSSAQAKYLMVNKGRAPNSPQLYTYAASVNAYRNATNLANVGVDFNSTITSATPIRITVTGVRNITVTPSVVGNYRAAGDP